MKSVGSDEAWANDVEARRNVKTQPPILFMQKKLSPETYPYVGDPVHGSQ